MSLVNTGKLYTSFLSILPVISIYRMPGMAISLATVLTALAMIYAAISLIRRKIKISFLILQPFLVYLFYIVTKSSLSFILLCVALMIHVLAIGTGIVNEKRLRRIIETISVIAAVSVIMQQLIHITTGIHIPLYIGSLFIGEMKEQYSVALTTSVIDGLYRPSAFFLEPAHFTQYCIIGLGTTLFAERPDFKKAALISFGIFATTSGMGLVSTFIMWGWWYVTRYKMSIGKMILLLISAVVLVFILNNISFTHNIISRITADPDSGDYNAIYGRIWWWDTYFGDFSLSAFMFGFGMDSLPEDAYFTGFMKQLYCYGIIGTTLLILFLILLLIKSNNLGRACIIIYTLLFFFADLTGYVDLLFYFGTFLTFYVGGNIFFVSNKKSLKSIQ